MSEWWINYADGGVCAGPYSSEEEARAIAPNVPTTRELVVAPRPAWSQ